MVVGEAITSYLNILFKSISTEYSSTDFFHTVSLTSSGLMDSLEAKDTVMLHMVRVPVVKTG